MLTVEINAMLTSAASASSESQVKSGGLPTKPANRTAAGFSTGRWRPKPTPVMIHAVDDADMAPICVVPPRMSALGQRSITLTFANGRIVIPAGHGRRRILAHLVKIPEWVPGMTEMMRGPAAGFERFEHVRPETGPAFRGERVPDQAIEARKPPLDGQ